MRTLITERGHQVFWAVLPPVAAIPLPSFGTATTRVAAERAADQYITSAERSRGFNDKGVSHVR